MTCLYPSQYDLPEGNVCYLRNKDAGYLGNAPVWWAKNGQGYTAYLENAERFDEQEAEKMMRHDPEKWEAWPCCLIDKHVHTVFDWQDIRHIKDEMDKRKVKP